MLIFSNADSVNGLLVSVHSENKINDVEDRKSAELTAQRLGGSENIQT
jgi:hypothetical protein